MAKVRVLTKGHTHFGVIHPPINTEYEIDQNGKQITIWKNGVQHRTFKIGDTAEYDSYNLSYTGVIDKITSKCVTIIAHKGSSIEKTHRLDMNKFCWRNYNFDAVKTAEENSNISMYL
jgi:hypothetical protein